MDMKRAKKRWEDETLLHIGRSEAHADFHRSADKGKELLLDGEWKFLFLPAPEYSPEGFFESDFPCGDWDKIPVPSCLERQGYGKPHYTDVWYLFPVNPPFVPPDNPTGIYRRSFTLAPEETGGRTVIRFDGVSSAFDLWVNGQHAGYSKVSRLGSEFDITRLVHEGENQLTVRTYRWSDGTYLECQDMWWWSGIFRSVRLLILPECPILDLQVTAGYDERTGQGALCAEVFCGADVRGGGCTLSDGSDEIAAGGGHTGERTLAQENSKESEHIIEWKLSDGSGRQVASGTEDTWADRGEGKKSLKFSASVPEVIPWNAEKPYLYRLEVRLLDGEHAADEVYTAAGFRTVRISGHQFLVNGCPILLNGVNLHDYSPKGGLTVEREVVTEDLMLMKRYNINAIRCSHYPKASWFYELCDELGFYVIDEADLENHGFEWIEHYDWLNNLDSWKAAYTDRVLRMIREHRNHPCILMWSLGNEASTGSNFDAAAEAARREDPTRLIHYEGDPKADITDVYSTMYTRLAQLKEIGEGNDGHGKPHILCEYGHCMGNGPGNLEEYQELFRKYDRLQGGFLWEWYDQGLEEKGPDGKTVYRYGGDYGDFPNNGNFCLDGLLTPDRRASSGLLHYSQVIAPVGASLTDRKNLIFRIENRKFFTGLDDLALTAEYLRDGDIICAEEVPLPEIPPRGYGEIRLSFPEAGEDGAEYLVNLLFRRKEGSAFARKGDQAAAFQFLVKESGDPETERSENRKPDADPGESREPAVTETPVRLMVSASDAAFVFDKVKGKLLTVTRNGETVIQNGPRLTWRRAAIDNDMYKRGDWEKKYFLDQETEEAESFETGREMTPEGPCVRVAIQTYFSSLSMAFGFRAGYVYRIFSDGSFRLSVKLKGFARTPFVPQFIPRIGLEMVLPREYQNVTWYGLGPMENYPDMKSAARLGIYEQTVDGFHEGYIRPQENGHRCETRWICIAEPGGTEIRAEAASPLGFDVHDYTIDALQAAAHDDELKRGGDTVLHLDAKHSGLGSNSCGEEQTFPNKTKLNDYVMDLRFSMRDSRDAR